MDKNSACGGIFFVLDVFTKCLCMHISIAAEKLFDMWGFPVTNTVLLTLLVSVILIVFSMVFFKNLSDVPGRFQSAIEAIFEVLWKFILDIAGSQALARKIFPLIATIFFFVLFSNWTELIPGLGTIGIQHGHAIIPFIRSPSADLNMTMALALVAVFSIQYMGVATIGAVKYAKKFFISPFAKPYGIGMFVGILELLGEATKFASFSFRLFGNIFAGEVLLIVIVYLVPYFIPLPFLFLEIFVGLVQASVFAILTLVFIKMATMEHDTAH